MIVEIHLKTSVVLTGRTVNMLEGEMRDIDSVDKLINMEGHVQLRTEIGKFVIPWSNIAMIFTPTDQRRANRDQARS